MVIVSASDGTGVAILFAVAAVVGVLSIAWHFGRSRSLLETWAAENGYRIISSQYRFLARGPFFWTTSKSQSVYRVEVQDPAGRRRTGYVRCGTWLGGLLSNKVEARWDDDA